MTRRKLRPAAPGSRGRRIPRALADEIFSTVVEHAFDSIVIVAADGIVAYANPACRAVFGAPPGDLIGANLLALIHPGDADSLRAALARVASAPAPGGAPLTLEARVRRQDDWLVTENVLTGLALPDRRGVVINTRDISERRRAETLMRGRAQLFERIATTTPLEQVLTELILLVESQADSVRGAIVLLALDDGHADAQLTVAPSLPPACVPAVEDSARLYTEAALAAGGVFDGAAPRVDHPGASPYWQAHRPLAERFGLAACWSLPVHTGADRVHGVVQLYARAARPPTPTEQSLAEMTAYIARIAIERERTIDQARHMAHHDELTGLPNRSLLKQAIGAAIDEAEAGRNMAAVMFIDLDHFKVVNDTLGHHIGDLLLQVVAARLHHCLRQDDSVARLGGDEFVITLHKLHGSGEAAYVAAKVLAALQAPFSVDRHELRIGASIGIGMYPQDGEDVDALMQAADSAMYAAKSGGRNTYRFHTQGLDTALQRRQAILGDMRQALQRGEFSLLYQPQVDIGTRRILSAEALLRWSAREQAVPPAEFIPIAEENGLILQLGEWVLDQACHQLRAWRDAGFGELRLAVNLSLCQVLQVGFAERLGALLRDCGLRPSDLHLEISEHTLMQPGAENIHGLKTLSDAGVRLAVDDFGSGSSNLSSLQRVPLHALKIDPSFVHGIGRGHDDMAIIDAIIAVGHSLHLEVIAEGVETGEQAAYLREHGCTAAQGYYFGKPVSAEQFGAYLRRQ